MDHEADAGQIDPARGDIGGDADPRAAIAQRLHRLIAFGLRMLARQRNHPEAALLQRGVQPADTVARGAEQDRGLGLVEAQQVDRCSLDFSGGDGHCLEGDIAMAALVAGSGDADRILLVALGQRDDRLGHGGREQQGAATRGGRVEDFLEVFAEAHIEHLVGLVEDRGVELREVERSALEVVAQAAGSADDDMRAIAQCAAFLGGVHPPDAGRDPRTRPGVEPAQLAADLQREFAGRGDHQRQRQLGGLVEALEQLRGEREPEGDGLARAGLRGDHQIAALGFRRQHGGLDFGGFFITALGERGGQDWRKVGKGHHAHGDGPGRGRRQAGLRGFAAKRTGFGQRSHCRTVHRLGLGAGLYSKDAALASIVFVARLRRAT